MTLDQQLEQAEKVEEYRRIRDGFQALRGLVESELPPSQAEVRQQFRALRALARGLAGRCTLEERRGLRVMFRVSLDWFQSRNLIDGE